MPEYKKKGGKPLSMLLVLAMFFSLVFTVSQVDANDSVSGSVAGHVYQHVDIGGKGDVLNTAVLSAGVEPASVVLGNTLAYYRSYKTTLDSWWELVALRGAGVDLHDGTWTLPQWQSSDLQETDPATDYAGFILGMLARGDDPARAWGVRNLLQELSSKQDDNGSFGLVNQHIWAMVALDAAGAGYDEAKAVQYLLNLQKTDGGFALSGSMGDPDITGMALVALSGHRDKEGVPASMAAAVNYLKGAQLGNAGFASWGMDNGNSLSTVISGLVAVGEDVLSGDWVKDGVTVIDSLARFQLDNGSFSYSLPKTYNTMATIQALLALGDLVDGEIVFNRLDPVPQGEVPGAATVQLRVEGIQQNVFDGTVTVESSGEPQTALDALKQGLDSIEVPYEIKEGAWGPYIKSINGEEAAAFGGWDGWLFMVNGALASVGAGDYQVQEGDSLLFYYGEFPPATLYPEVTVIPSQPAAGQAIEVKVTASYFDWSAGKMAMVNVEGAAVSFKGRIYHTDVNGMATIPGAANTEAGAYNLKVSKEVAESYPALVRTGNIPVSIIIQEIDLAGDDRNYSVGNSPVKLNVDKDLTNAALTLTTQPDDEVLRATLPSVEVNADTGIGTVNLTFHDNTGVTGPAGWDGTINLPRVLPNTSVTVAGGNVNVVLEVGYPGGELVFDKPVRLLLPGQAGKSAGFARGGGSVREITHTLGEDSLAAASLLPIGGSGKIDVGPDLVIWTKHFTKFVAYTKTTSSPGGGGGFPDGITVTVNVVGKAGELYSGSVTLPAGKANALEALRQTGLPFATRNNESYVYEIAGEREDASTTAGWKYKVNGIIPGVPAIDYAVKNGDAVVWWYAGDLASTGPEQNLPRPVPLTTPGGQPPGAELTRDISKTINYYQGKNKLDSWWELAALWGAGADLHGGQWALPRWTGADLPDSQPGVDYAGYMLGLLARGESPSAWAGRNLVSELQSKQQADGGFGGAINNTIWAIIALDVAGGQYDQAGAIQYLLSSQKLDGGFALAGATGDPDVTGMALMALSGHKDKDGVQTSISRAVSYLKEAQLDTAGFASGGADNSNSLSTVISGLVAAGEDVLSGDWTRDGVTVLDSLLRFQLADGSMSYLLEPKRPNAMATSQALIALGDLVAGKSLWLRLKNKEKTIMAPAQTGLRFDDVSQNHWAFHEINQLSSRGIIHGVGMNRFEPQREITRAEFTSLLVKALGLKVTDTGPVFTDVKPGAWYAGSVQAAYEAGIVHGMGDKIFRPHEIITREQMAAMLAAVVDKKNSQYPLAYKDTDKISAWALPAIRTLAAMNLTGGFPDGEFKPGASANRAQAAVLIYRMLNQ